MPRVRRMQHEFVEYIPTDLTNGIIYVSLDYATATHRCCCGCGAEVVTPLSPTDWTLTFDGVSVSLDPSIGNWSFACRSHYWVTRNNVVWAPKWTRRRIAAGRAADMAAKQGYYSKE